MDRRNDLGDVSRVTWSPTGEPRVLTPAQLRARREAAQLHYLEWDARQEVLRTGERRQRLRTISAGVTIGLGVLVMLGFVAWEAMQALDAFTRNPTFNANSFIARMLIATILGTGGGVTISLRRPAKRGKNRR